MKRSVKKILEEIDALQNRLLKIQTKCEHLNATKESGGNTGNYDPSADRYWNKYSCPDCLKKWTVDTTSY